MLLQQFEAFDDYPHQMGKKDPQRDGNKQPNHKYLINHSVRYGKKDIYRQEKSPAKRLKQPIFRNFLDQIDHGIKLIQFFSMGKPFIKKEGDSR